MKTVTFFDKLDELKALTGLSESADLWDAGFNLDDWDFGFVSDTEWDEWWGSDTPYFEWWLLEKFNHYACGYNHTEYNGKHYYILYHS